MLTLRPATSGTVYVTPVAGDEVTVAARAAARRDPLVRARDADSASRFLDLELGVFARWEKSTSGSSGTIYVTFVSGDQFAAEPAREAERCEEGRSAVALLTGRVLGPGLGRSGSMHVTPVAGDEVVESVPECSVLAYAA